MAHPPQKLWALALSGILLLGALAAWLMNFPLWLISVGLVAGALLIRRISRRLLTKRARQDTEA